MRLYLKGNYETSIYQACMEYPWKMWFKERKGVQVGFSYARDDDFYLVLVWINFLQMMSVGEWQILKKKITHGVHLNMSI